MTDPDLPALRKLAEEASPGPWEASGTLIGVSKDGREWLHVATTQLFADAAHIAAFDPPTALALIARAERLSPVERKAIDALLDVATAAWHLADNSADNRRDVDGEEVGEITVEGKDFQDLSDALDRLDELPDDQPGYTMDSAAKAAWALRAFLANASPTQKKNDEA